MAFKAVTTRADIPTRLRDGFATVFSSKVYDKEEWREIYTVHKSSRAYEEDVEMKMLGLAQVQAEGAPIAMSENISEAITTFYNHKKIKMMFSITEEAVKDDQYDRKMLSGAEALRVSMKQTKEVLGASLLNNAVNPNNPIGDGQPLLSSAHTLANGGRYSNTPATATDLNEASIEQALALINGFRDQAGLRVPYKFRKLIVAPGLQLAAEKLLASRFDPASNNNSVNPVNSLGLFPEGYAVNHYLTGQKSWFILTDAPGMKMFQRQELETDLFIEPQTGNYQHIAMERYSFGCSNPRAIIGSVLY